MAETETYTFGFIVTMFLTALGAFAKDTIMLTSTHEKAVADWKARITEERDRAEDERRRADRWMEIGMRTTGVTEELVAVAKSRDIRDIARDTKERRG